jgi:hypothetical protein
MEIEVKPKQKPATIGAKGELKRRKSDTMDGKSSQIFVPL